MPLSEILSLRSLGRIPHKQCCTSIVLSTQHSFNEAHNLQTHSMALSQTIVQPSVEGNFFAFSTGWSCNVVKHFRNTQSGTPTKPPSISCLLICIAVYSDPG